MPDFKLASGALNPAGVPMATSNLLGTVFQVWPILVCTARKIFFMEHFPGAWRSRGTTLSRVGQPPDPGGAPSDPVEGFVAYLSSIEEKQRYQAILEIFLRVFSPAAREGGGQNPRQSHQQVRNRVATSSNAVSRETVANSRGTGKKTKPIRLPENRDEETILLESVQNRLKEDSLRDDGVPQPLLGRRFILWNADPALEAERYVSSNQRGEKGRTTEFDDAWQQQTTADEFCGLADY